MTKRPAELSPLQANTFRALAAQTEGIDVDVYESFSKDPLDPIIGLGPVDARIAFFGRDPGREEVRYGEPFIGAGGQLVRRALYRHLYGENLPGYEASRAVSRDVFWMNTVPYKPIGNRAWSMAVKRRFHPLMLQVLTSHWQGRDIITLGREAFLWFGLEQSRDARQRIETFWRRDDRFTATCDVELTTEEGYARRFTLYPLPHPSPRNMAWFKHFPDLLDARLQQLLDDDASAPRRQEPI